MQNRELKKTKEINSIVVDEETKPRYFRIKRSRKYLEGWINGN